MPRLIVQVSAAIQDKVVLSVLGELADNDLDADSDDEESTAIEDYIQTRASWLEEIFDGQ